MTFNINNFRQVFEENGGGQRTTLFSVDIPMPAGLQAMAAVAGAEFINTQKVMKFYCEAVNLPGMQLASSQIRRYGYGNLEEKPFTPVFTTCDMRIIADGGGNIWQFLQTWMKFVCNFDSRNGMDTATGFSTASLSAGTGTAVPNQFAYELNYEQDYAVNITISLYKPTGELAMSVILTDAYPKFIGDIQFNFGDVNNLMRIPISFAFGDWYNSVLIGGNNVTFQSVGNTQTVVNNTVINTK